MQDSAFDVAEFVSRIIGRRIGRKQASHLAVGIGVSMPLGLFWANPDMNLDVNNPFNYPKLKSWSTCLTPRTVRALAGS